MESLPKVSYSVAIKNWKKEALKIGISRAEQEMMEGAFRI